MSRERLEEAKFLIDYEKEKIPPELYEHIDFITEQAERAQELEGKLDRIRFVNNDYDRQNKRYREAIESMRSEVKYALYSNKSEDVKRHYLQNAEREADEALEGEE